MVSVMKKSVPEDICCSAAYPPLIFAYLFRAGIRPQVITGEITQ